MGTTQYDIWTLCRLYISKKYNLPNCELSIELTTKRNPKIISDFNKYTMFVRNSLGELTMKSEEIEGYHKNNHTSSNWATFLATLKEIENENNNSNN